MSTLEWLAMATLEWLAMSTLEQQVGSNAAYDSYGQHLDYR